MQSINNNIKISFINVPLTVVNDRDELLQIMNDPKTEGKLSNLDLSLVELANIRFTNYELCNIVFNAFNPEKRDRKELFNLDFEGCKFCQVSFAHCNIERCNFDTIADVSTTTMEKVDFFFCKFDYSRFKSVEMRICDFRYSEINNCSMGGVKADICDFYMTAFKGVTNFIESQFTRCSFTNAVFENHCITMHNLQSLVQEDYDAYANIIINLKTWHKINPCASQSYLNKSEQKKKSIVNGEATVQKGESVKVLKLKSMQSNAKEAQQLYTIFSGIYNGKGLNHDSNEAYRRAKICENNYYWLSVRVHWATCKFWKIPGDCFKMLTPFSSMLFGFGYMLLPIFIISSLIVLAFASYIYGYSDTSSGSFWQDLVASMHNMLSPLENHFNHLLDKVIALLQTCFGILILGFLGFIFANRVRNDG